MFFGCGQGQFPSNTARFKQTLQKVPNPVHITSAYRRNSSPSHACAPDRKFKTLFLTGPKSLKSCWRLQEWRTSLPHRLQITWMKAAGCKLINPWLPHTWARLALREWALLCSACTAESKANKCNLFSLIELTGPVPFPHFTPNPKMSTLVTEQTQQDRSSILAALCSCWGSSSISDRERGTQRATGTNSLLATLSQTLPEEGLWIYHPLKCLISFWGPLK